MVVVVAAAATVAAVLVKCDIGFQNRIRKPGENMRDKRLAQSLDTA